MLKKNMTIFTINSKCIFLLLWFPTELSVFLEKWSLVFVLCIGKAEAQTVNTGEDTIRDLVSKTSP